MEHSYRRLETFEELRASVAGQWEYIFSDLAPELAEAIGRAPHHVPCPVHGGTDGFRLYRDYQETGGGVCNSCGAFRSGFQLLAWVRGYTSKDATRDIGQWKRGEQANPTTEIRKPPKEMPKPIEPEKAYARIRDVWLESKPIRGTPAEAYLLNRGIPRQFIPNTLRFHPALSWYDAKKKASIGKFPCLIAPIMDAQGRVLSVHRIYLTNDGMKADVPEVKKMMAAAGDLRGSAIKLMPARTVLGLSEGIETGLAAIVATKMPVWPCISARLMESVVIPDHVELVVIWADLDRSGTGLASAQRLKKRLEAEGKRVIIALPPGTIPEGSKGIDWLDVLDTQGVAGFPTDLLTPRPEVRPPEMALAA